MCRCFYGAALAAAALGGELARTGVLQQRVLDWSTGEAVWIYSRPKM